MASPVRNSPSLISDNHGYPLPPDSELHASMVTQSLDSARPSVTTFFPSKSISTGGQSSDGEKKDLPEIMKESRSLVSPQVTYSKSMDESMSPTYPSPKKSYSSAVLSTQTLSKHQLSISEVDGNQTIHIPDDIFKDSAPLWEDFLV